MGLRPTFMGFETASRGLTINQKAQDVIAGNVANLGVYGYTRQRVDQMSMSINNRNTRYALHSALAGQGATISGVSQIRNTFLDKRYREETSDVGYYDMLTGTLEDVYNAVDEVQPEQLNSALSKLRDAWGEVVKQKGDEVSCSGVLAASRAMTQVLQQLDAKLANVWDQQKYNLNINVETMNTALSQVAELNSAIKKEYSALDYTGGYYGPNELLDQRNVLLDQLSSYGDMRFETQSDGTVKVFMGGHTVVDGESYDQLNLQDGASDETVKLFWNSTGKNVNFTSGALKASVEMLNGKGIDGKSDKGETFDNGIKYYREKMDVLARTFADTFNKSIAICDPNDSKKQLVINGVPQYKTLFTFDASTTGRGAGSIRVNPDWASDSSYVRDGIVRDGDEDVSSFELIDTYFDDKEAKLDFGEFTGSFTGYVTFYTTTLLGTQKTDADARLKASASVQETVEKQILNVSGVSVNEEAADSMRYQKAYDAMSRVMTVLDDLLDKLINGTGRAGL